MTRLVIDAALRDKILAANGDGVELCDESGQFVCRVVKPLPYPDPPEGYEYVGEWESDEEIDRRLASDDWVSAAEVEAFLAGLKRGASHGG